MGWTILFNEIQSALLIIEMLVDQPDLNVFLFNQPERLRRFSRGKNLVALFAQQGTHALQNGFIIVQTQHFISSVLQRC